MGTHRRVTFKDLLAYESKRDRTRRDALDKLAAETEKAGLYDSDCVGDSESGSDELGPGGKSGN